MNSTFQAIIATPAMFVPAMTTEEIRNTLLEASIEYIKKSINLETLTLLASNIQHFMGMRGSEEAQLTNVLNRIVTSSQNLSN